jgi:RNA polymerase sigma-70 factor, ECF subfamily
MLNTKLSEAEAIHSAMNGEVAGFEALYDLHKRQVYAWCLRFSGNVPDAEDLTQEVFLQVYRKISTFRGDAKFGSWLYRVAFNLAGMRFRRCPPEVSLNTCGVAKQGRLRLESGSRNYCVSSALERVALRQAIGSLSRGKRNVVLLRDVEGYTHAEVARHLGLSVGTSKSQLHKAHVALRETLDRPARRATPEPVTLDAIQLSAGAPG